MYSASSTRRPENAGFEDAGGGPNYGKLLDRIHANFDTRKSFPYEYRVQQLNSLKRGLMAKQTLLMEAIAKDLLNKHPFESFQEVGVLATEIDYTLDNLSTWMAPESVPTPLFVQPGSNVIFKQPKGVVLIISPWNYPTILTMCPLINAIAAGCAAVIKPSELSPHSASVLERVIVEHLDPDLYVCVQGGVPETTALLKEKWNHILYTGNGKVGRTVAKAAAENLASYTLELGGKSPVYVSAHANIYVAARRILGCKLFNGGQTCLAPDYVLVHESVRDSFIAELRKHLKEWLGENPQTSDSFTRLIGTRHFDRVLAMLQDDHGGQVLEGGVEKADRDDRYIPPTLILDPKRDCALLQEEIFGPILPILTVKRMDEALKFVDSLDSPLAAYIFTEKTSEVETFIKMTKSGGTCVNDCMLHNFTSYMPLGGHSGGGSGVGCYRGVYGFKEFTHLRATYSHSTLLNPSIRYPPYQLQAIKLLDFYFFKLTPSVLKSMKVLCFVGIAALFRSRFVL